MLKRLAIFAIAALAAFCMACQPDKTANAHNQQGHIKEAIVSKTPPVKQPEPAQDQTASDTDAPHWYTPLKRPDWWLVIVGVVGTFLALRTLKNIERQTKTGEIAANAAFSNAQAVFLSERARIVAKVIELDSRRFHIQGWNVGRVPAKVTLIQGWHLILPYGEKLPTTPPYLSHTPYNRDYVEWVPSKEFIDIMPDDDSYRLVADLSADELYTDIMNKNLALWVYGRICYEDGIFPEIRETRFCYETALDERMDLDLVMSGPVIYRLET